MARYIENESWFVGTGYITLGAVAALPIWDTDDFVQHGSTVQLAAVTASTTQFEFEDSRSYKITVSYVTDDDAFADATFDVQLYDDTGTAVIESFSFTLIDSVFNAGTFVFVLDAVALNNYSIRALTPTAAADVKFTIGFERL